MEWTWIFNKNIFGIDSCIFFNETSINNINNTKTLKTLKSLDSIYNKSFNYPCIRSILVTIGMLAYDQ